jgi:Uma2 family endonuclease
VGARARALEPVKRAGYDHGVTSSAAPGPDAEFPNLPPEVVAGYRNAPDNMIAEVLDGELSVMPRRPPRHALAAGELLGELRGPFRLGRGGPGGWIFLAEPELHLGRKPDIIVPDVAGWRQGRLSSEAFADDAPAAITIPPDWGCEVLSDRAEALDRGKKRRIYRRDGVGHYWLVDPRDKRLEIYRLEAGRWVEVAEHEGDGVVRAEPFDAIELDLSLLWKI